MFLLEFVSSHLATKQPDDEEAGSEQAFSALLKHALPGNASGTRTNSTSDVVAPVRQVG